MLPFLPSVNPSPRAIQSDFVVHPHLPTVRKTVPLHREEARKEIGPDGQGKQPQADASQHQTAPALHAGRSGLERIDHPLLGSADDHGQPEHKDSHRHRGHGEGDEGRGRTTGSNGVPGQTGQDGARSAETGQDIAEPKQAEGQRRPLVVQPGLGLDEGSGHDVHSIAARRDALPL